MAPPEDQFAGLLQETQTFRGDPSMTLSRSMAFKTAGLTLSLMLLGTASLWGLCGMRETLRAEVAEIIRPLGVTVLLVTHDREEAFSLADRIALMRDGTVVQEGTAEELYFSPADRWAAEFVGAANVLSGRLVGGRIETAIGAFPAAGSTGTGTQVLIRPELLELQPSATGPAEVVAREFRGHDVFYRVRLDGIELVSQRPSTEVVDLGSRVAIRVHDGRVPVLD
jgi:iron(III) transport system ATP-binding protein